MTIPGGSAMQAESGSLRRSLPMVRRGDRITDAAFRYFTLLCALIIISIVGFLILELTHTSMPTIQKFGMKFFAVNDWDPVNDNYGALPFLYGTLVTSAVSLAISIPLGLGLAIFINEICPRGFRGFISFFTELLAAIPSVIYGLWAIFVLVPLMREHVQPFLQHYLGWTGLFTGAPFGVGLGTAGVVLSIMVLPIISSVSREVMAAVPKHQREAALALGATQWEMIRLAILGNSRSGIFGAIILGLGRALGETMAVTMVIGNVPQIAKSLLAPGDTLASVIANQFSEATGDLYRSALIEIGLALLIITLIVNMLARVLVWFSLRGAAGRVHA
jgi:phosphate transport system permease protein